VCVTQVHTVPYAPWRGGESPPVTLTCPLTKCDPYSAGGPIWRYVRCLPLRAGRAPGRPTGVSVEGSLSHIHMVVLSKCSTTRRHQARGLGFELALGVLSNNITNMSRSEQGNASQRLDATDSKMLSHYSSKRRSLCWNRGSGLRLAGT
jgi:hypothetical protein